MHINIKRCEYRVKLNQGMIERFIKCLILNIQIG